MSDENLDQNSGNSDQQNSGQQQDRSENRFKDLSDKYAKEAEARKLAEEEKSKIQREVEFYKGFTPLTSKYQSAGEFQEKIKEKVLAGYDVEDATIAVLTREGKFQSQSVEPPRPKESPAGGSATTTIRNKEKNFNEMNTAEMRDELIKLEQETGGLSGLFNRTL